MRFFTPQEKNILEFFYKLKKEDKKLNHRFFGDVLLKIFDYRSIVYDNNSGYVHICLGYEISSDKEDEIRFKEFNRIFDLFFLFKELEEMGLLKKYKYPIPNDRNLLVNDRYHNLSKPSEIDIASKRINKLDIYDVELCRLFKEYRGQVFLPTTLLEDLVKYDFKDVEQRRFEKVQCTTWSAILVSILIGVGSLIVPTYCSTPTEIDSTQVEVIESAIKSTKTEYPTRIDVSLQDTLIVKDIESKQIINKIYYGEEK